MTTRILPEAEWGRLEGTETVSTAEMRVPNAKVVVVEDEGTIVGSWVKFDMPHVEGIWIAPSHRKKCGVLRRLLGTMRECVGAVPLVWTTTQYAEVVTLAEKCGGVAVAGSNYLVPVSRKG